MKKALAKLKNKSGETIAEVLVALLVSSLGLVMLASMINASTNIIAKSRSLMEEYYTEKAETIGSVDVKITINEKVYTYTMPSYQRPLSGKNVTYYVIEGD
jgi:hypothetical protein